MKKKSKSKRKCVNCNDTVIVKKNPYLLFLVSRLIAITDKRYYPYLLFLVSRLIAFTDKRYSELASLACFSPFRVSLGAAASMPSPAALTGGVSLGSRDLDLCLSASWDLDLDHENVIKNNISVLKEFQAN